MIPLRWKLTSLHEAPTWAAPITGLKIEEIEAFAELYTRTLKALFV